MNPKNLLIDTLLNRGWVTGAALSTELGLNERHLRALAEESEGWVISGQLGYKLTTEATPEEIRACVARFRSQAIRMNDRAETIERIYAGMTSPSLEAAPHDHDHLEQAPVVSGDNPNRA
jgi:hypothetical protein